MKCLTCGMEYEGQNCPNGCAPVQQDQQQQAQAQQPPAQQPAAQPQYQQPTIIINNANTNTNVAGAGGTGISPKSKIVALLLCFFLGFLGAHRFYVGKAGSGILYIFTGGLFGIGVLVDFINIICGNFKDNMGLFLKN